MGFFGNIGANPPEYRLWVSGRDDFKKSLKPGDMFCVPELKKAFIVEETYNPKMTEFIGRCVRGKCVGCAFNNKMNELGGYCSCPIYCNSNYVIKEL